MKLYILTDSKYFDYHFDDKKLIEELKQQDFEPIAIIWDQQSVPDNSYVLVRTIWDYALKSEEFKKLLNDFSYRNIKVINPIDTLMWNMDKSYLLELQKSGASVVPTSVSHSFDIAVLKDPTFFYPCVIKPLVGASGRDTFLLMNQNHGEDLSTLLGRSVLIQPFMRNIKEEGEISFLYFAREFSHAVVKTAKNSEFRIQEEHGGSVSAYQPTEDDFIQVEDILSKITYQWHYARVDVVRDQSKLYLMELELIEPELFLRFSDGGEIRLVQAIKKALK